MEYSPAKKSGIAEAVAGILIDVELLFLSIPTVLVLACAGGVGQLLVQIAKMKGAGVIGLIPIGHYSYTF